MLTCLSPTILALTIVKDITEDNSKSEFVEGYDYRRDEIPVMIAYLAGDIRGDYSNHSSIKERVEAIEELYEILEEKCPRISKKYYAADYGRSFMNSWTGYRWVQVEGVSFFTEAARSYLEDKLQSPLSFHVETSMS
jgi:hypothetical protein